MTDIDLRPIWEQRADMGLTTPTPEEKRFIWSQVSIPQARISKDDGGYKPFRIVDMAHDHPARAILLAGGIRGSKSVSSAMEVVAWAPHSDLIWLGADSYDLSRQEFEYAVEALLSLDWTKPSLVSLPNNRYQPCAVETRWGTLIETRTLHDINTFVARAPDLIVICEPGLANEASVRRAYERTSTKRGRVLMAGTFEEVRGQWMEEYWRKWARWPNYDNGKSFTVPSWVNRVIYPGGKHDPEIALLRRRCVDFNEFLRRVVGVPSVESNVIMADVWNQREHVVPLEYIRRDDPTGTLVPVYIAVDPGHSDGTYVVLAIQVIDDTIRVIDEIALTGETHDGVIRHCIPKPWWPAVTRGACDPYAGGSHVFGAPSPQRVWWQEARVYLELPERLHVEEQIMTIKSYLRDPLSGKPRIVVDPKCERLIYEMSHWRRKKTRDGQGKPSRGNCDAIKALAAFLIWWSTVRAAEQSHQALVSEFSLS